MKKVFLAMVLIVSVFALSACGRSASGEKTGGTAASENPEEIAGSGTAAAVKDGEGESLQASETAEAAEPETETETEGQTETVVPEAETQEPETKWEWQHDAPENHGVDTGVLNRIHTALDSTDILAMVVVKDDRIVDEYYKDGYDETSVFRLYSCSKSVTSALMGIAIDKGLIDGVDVPVSAYFPQAAQGRSDGFDRITIRHLLTHTSGIDASDTNDWGAWINSDNWVDFVLNRPVAFEPGTVFQYFTGGSHLLAAIIQEAADRTLYEFGKEYLFDPLGMDSVECGTDAQGVSDGGNGFAMNVYDMAKLGRLFLNGGVWEGQQIISEEWVRESTALQFQCAPGSADYGYQWWVRTFGKENYDAYFAQGHFGQFIFCVPDLDLIVVFTSHHEGSNSMYWQFVSDIVAGCAG